MTNKALPLIALLVLAGCETHPAGGPVAFKATQGTFLHEVSANGTVFSQGGKEVRCEVEGESPEGTMILEIVPEGTSVQPGNRLVQLDTSALKDKLLQQQIVCNGIEAAVVAAEGEKEKAQLSLDEYVKGLFPEERKAAEDELFAAQKLLERATHKLEAAEGEASSAESTAEDKDSLRFDVEMAKREVEGAKKRLDVLDTLTKPLRLKQLEGDVGAADATLRAKQKELSLHTARLGKIEKQIEACTISAPVAGVVFYAHVPAELEEDEILIGEGTMVHRRQVILHLAQLDQLSVRIELPESDFGHLQKDMPAMVYVDAMPETVFDGHVSMIHPYPTRETRGTAGKKKYEVHVAIDNPSGTLRPGLTAEAVMTVAEVDDAVQVPATSVFEEGDGENCLVRKGGRWKVRSVVTGANDDKMTVIREGLQPGEEVAIHPLQYRDQAVQ